MTAEQRLQELQALAEQWGGKCLSEHYIHSESHLHWQCAEGHQWTATPNCVKNLKSWCPTCAINEERLGLPEMQALAIARRGKCLSSVYINAFTPLRWQCEFGHIWATEPRQVKYRNAWCPICAKDKTRLGLAKMQALAAERGGECLSTEYVNSRSSLLWQCAAKHQWSAAPTNVKGRKSWCPTCAGKANADKRRGKKRGRLERLTIEEMQDIATLRGGQCLSDEYVNSYTCLRWRCKLGHEWDATPSSIKYHQCWCPECALEDQRVGLGEMQALALAQKDISGKPPPTASRTADIGAPFVLSKGSAWGCRKCSLWQLNAADFVFPISTSMPALPCVGSAKRGINGTLMQLA